MDARAADVVRRWASAAPPGASAREIVEIAVGERAGGDLAAVVAEEDVTGPGLRLLRRTAARRQAHRRHLGVLLALWIAVPTERRLEREEQSEVEAAPRAAYDETV